MSIISSRLIITDPQASLSINSQEQSSTAATQVRMTRQTIASSQLVLLIFSAHQACRALARSCLRITARVTVRLTYKTSAKPRKEAATTNTVLSASVASLNGDDSNERDDDALDLLLLVALAAVIVQVLFSFSKTPVIVVVAATWL